MITDVVTVSINVRDTKIAVSNFGTPLLLTYHDAFIGEVREYDADGSGLAAMVTDGFAVTSAAYRLASAICSQETHCASFKVGCRSCPTFQEVVWTPSWTTVGRVVYMSLDFAGTTYEATYTPEFGDDAEAVVDGLIADLGTIVGVTIAKSGSGAAATLTMAVTAPWSGELIWPVSFLGLEYDDASADPSTPTSISATDATPSVETIATETLTKPGVLSEFSVTLGVCGTADSTTVIVAVNSTPVPDCSITIANDDDDPTTVTLTAADFGVVNLDVGDVVTIEVSAVAAGAADLAASVGITHSALGVAADLAANTLVDADWYGLLLDTHSGAEITLAGAYAAANSKLFCALTSDSDNTTASSGVGYALSSATNHRAVVCATRNGAGFLDAALMGRQFSQDPGSSTWAHKILTGPVADAWTSSESSTLRGNGRGAIGNGCLIYVNDKGISHTYDGFAASGRHVDITRGLDWLQARIQEAILLALVSVEKVPYTEAGITLLESALAGVLSAAESATLLASGWRIERTAVEDVSAADKAARVFDGFKFFAVLQGAAQTLAVTGDVTV